MCTVRDYTLAHMFPAKSTLESAWQLQEMGVTGTGSTEHGDASGDIFWMPNATFLGFFYKTFPDMMPKECMFRTFAGMSG